MTAKNGLLLLEEIEIFYQISYDSIVNYYTSIQNGTLAPPPRLVGAPVSQLNDEKRIQLSELECNVVLTVLAMIEAWFRLDYTTRAREKASDNLSMVFRKLYGKVGAEARLEDILTQWRNNLTADKETISGYKGALKYRHWLAHGRYWSPSQKYDYVDAYQIATRIKNIVPV